MAQIEDLQDKVNSLNDAREFFVPETASTSGVSHVPSQPMSKWLAAFLACSLKHGIHWVLQETIMEVYFLEVDRPQHSSRCRRF